MKSVFEGSAYWVGVIVIGLVVGLGIQFATAWVSPGSNPPNGNVGAPLNTSSVYQLKAGILGVLGLAVNESTSTASRLQIIPSGTVDPTGKVLTAINSDGDAGWKSASASGSANEMIQCSGTAASGVWVGAACVNVETGRLWSRQLVGGGGGTDWGDGKIAGSWELHDASTVPSDIQCSAAATDKWVGMICTNRNTGKSCSTDLNSAKWSCEGNNAWNHKYD